MERPNDDAVLSDLIELISETAANFTPHRKQPEFRVPRRHTPLDPICDRVGADPANDAASISRKLFLLEWDSLPGYSSYWHLFALRLPSGDRAYWVDDLDGRRIIAVGPGGPGADAAFARVLFASNGEQFKAPIIDSAPSRVSTSLRGDLLIDVFLSAFSRSPNASEEFDTRRDVRWWLKETLTGGGRELRPKPLTRAEAQREFIFRVEGIVSDFTPHPEENGVGVPHRFTPLYPVAKSLRKKIDPLLYPLSYRLFQFAWWSVPGSTNIQQIQALLLPDATRVFWFFLEADDNEETRFYVAGTAAPDVTDLRFLQLLFKDNGKIFGVEVCGCAPSEIITPLKNIPELPDLFVAAYNGFPQAWDSLSDYQPKDRLLDHRDPQQARELVERHLDAVTYEPHRPSIG